MEHYGLSEEDSNQQISDLSLEDIARSSCRKWRDLPSRLVLPSILAEDIDRSGTGEGEKRLNFFREWKQMRGFDPTYKRFIGALLDIRCREDAESWTASSLIPCSNIYSDLFQKCFHSHKLGLLLLQQVTLNVCMYPRPYNAWATVPPLHPALHRTPSVKV